MSSAEKIKSYSAASFWGSWRNSQTPLSSDGAAWEICLERHSPLIAFINAGVEALHSNWTPPHLAPSSRTEPQRYSAGWKPTGPLSCYTICTKISSPDDLSLDFLHSNKCLRFPKPRGSIWGSDDVTGFNTRGQTDPLCRGEWGEISFRLGKFRAQGG